MGSRPAVFWRDEELTNPKPTAQPIVPRLRRDPDMRNILKKDDSGKTGRKSLGGAGKRLRT